MSMNPVYQSSQPRPLRRCRSNETRVHPRTPVAAFESLPALCADPRWLGGGIGALAVLHTWTRTPEWHPHLHVLVPAGALAADGRTWLAPKDRCKPLLVPVCALSKHFRGRFIARARAALPQLTLHVPWSKRWVVFAKPAVQRPERVLQYVARGSPQTRIVVCTCDASSDAARSGRRARLADPRGRTESNPQYLLRASQIGFVQQAPVYALARCAHSRSDAAKTLLR